MKKSWYRINALAGNFAALTIFDDIGGYGVTAAQFIQDLANLGDIKTLTLQINSQGGSVQDGVAIYNAIKQHPARVTVEINGWALSIASFIAMAGDTIRMADNALLMPHSPWLNITAMAENILSMNGKRTAGLDRAAVIKAAMTTSDFPELLANTAGKALTLGYDAEPTTHQIWTGEKEVPNFKQQSFVALSEAPGLLEVIEGAEYTHGAFGESAEKFSIRTWGRMLNITRQALINDDLQAFTAMPAAFGSSARRTEADLVYAKLTGTAVMSDNKELFHTDHGNLAASGTALSVDTLGAARAAMRRQKGIAGTSHVDPQPRFLIVPVGLESKAETLLNSMMLVGANNNTDNLQWIRNLTLVADPRLDDASLTAWYLAASPSQLDTIVRAYLAGQPRPFYEEELEFTRDATSIKCRLDFGCGVIDYRGLYKNPGA